MDLPPLSDPVSATRILCSALLLPTVATLCGKLFFDSVPSNLQRTVLVSPHLFIYTNIYFTYSVIHMSYLWAFRVEKCHACSCCDSAVSVYLRSKWCESQPSYWPSCVRFVLIFPFLQIQYASKSPLSKSLSDYFVFSCCVCNLCS